MARHGRKGSEGSAGKIATAPIIGSAVANAPSMGQQSSATVSFSAPVYSGKRDLDNVETQLEYEVRSNPGGLTSTGTGSPLTIFGLTPGVQYNFTVRAFNSLGFSPASNPSNTVTAISAPPVFVFVPPPPPPPQFPPPAFPPPVFPPPVFPPPVFPPPMFPPPTFPPPPPPPNFPPMFTPTFTPPMFFTPPAFFLPPSFPPMFVTPPMFTPNFPPPPPIFVPMFPPPPSFPPPPPRFPPPPPPRFPPPMFSR